MRPQNVVLTSTKRGSSHVAWNEAHEVTVQEPRSQVGWRVGCWSGSGTELRHDRKLWHHAPALVPAVAGSYCSSPPRSPPRHQRRPTTRCASNQRTRPVQVLHVSVFDVGSLSPSAMLSAALDPFSDSSSWRSRKLLGRASLPVSQACSRPGVAVEGWHQLTRGDWSVDFETAEHAGGLAAGLGWRPGSLGWQPGRCLRGSG
jgi:hypothetical protein